MYSDMEKVFYNKSKNQAKEMAESIWSESNKEISNSINFESNKLRFADKLFSLIQKRIEEKKDSIKYLESETQKIQDAFFKNRGGKDFEKQYKIYLDSKK
jgi:hypothetical protein